MKSYNRKTFSPMSQEAKVVKFSPGENIWLYSRYMWVVQVEIKYSVHVKVEFNADIEITSAIIRVRLRV